MQVQSTSSQSSTVRAVLNASASVLARRKAKVVEVVQLNRVNLKTCVINQCGKFVSVDYKKLDGETRTLTGRLGVTSYLRGGENKVQSDERPYMTMFDIQLRQYRTVNLSSVSEMRASGKRYTVID
jgi:hypothetical protein